MPFLSVALSFSNILQNKSIEYNLFLIGARDRLGFFQAHAVHDMVFTKVTQQASVHRPTYVSDAGAICIRTYWSKSLGTSSCE
jgi:hypothetical protein